MKLKRKSLYEVEGDTLESKNNFKHEIILEENVKPLNIKQYKIPFAHRDEIKEQINKLIKENCKKVVFKLQ